MTKAHEMDRDANPPAGWTTDPTGRHQLRYWDGHAWTEHVSSGGQQTVDPVDRAATSPVRVCPHCRTQAATAADRCPYCRKRYASRARWPWVVGGIALAFMLAFGGCLALIATAGKKISSEQAKHAITQQQFDAVPLDLSRSDVVRRLGKEPGAIQDFQDQGIVDRRTVDSSCIYYWRTDAGLTEVFQFCFRGDRLFHKGAVRRGS